MGPGQLLFSLNERIAYKCIGALASVCIVAWKCPSGIPSSVQKRATRVHSRHLDLHVLECCFSISASNVPVNSSQLFPSIRPPLLSPRTLSAATRRDADLSTRTPCGPAAVGRAGPGGPFDSGKNVLVFVIIIIIITGPYVPSRREACPAAPPAPSA